MSGLSSNPDTEQAPRANAVPAPTSTVEQCVSSTLPQSFSKHGLCIMTDAKIQPKRACASLQEANVDGSAISSDCTIDQLDEYLNKCSQIVCDIRSEIMGRFVRLLLKNPFIQLRLEEGHFLTNLNGEICYENPIDIVRDEFECRLKRDPHGSIQELFPDGFFENKNKLAFILSNQHQPNDLDGATIWICCKTFTWMDIGKKISGKCLLSLICYLSGKQTYTVVNEAIQSIRAA